MAELNEIQFFLLVSLMIFPAHALDVIISGARQNFKQRSEIKTNIVNGEKIYAGTVSRLTYETEVNISRVIVYIIDRSRYVEIIRNAVAETRSQIAEELKERNCELIFLGIENFVDDEHNLIGAFMLEKIQPHRNQTDQTLIIEVIGENRFDRSYQCHFVDFLRYRENPEICGGTLAERLGNIRHGALRPVESNNKRIKLLKYQPKVMEVTWSVRVENDKYIPEVEVDTPEYNFRMHHPGKKICVLVLGGQEYSAVSSLKNQSSERKNMREILRKMTSYNETFFIMGAFHFDWSEVYIVTQIILKHTQGLKGSEYNVFACGVGMFNTSYINWYERDGRFIRQPRNSNIMDIIKASMGEELKERKINMEYFDNRWKVLEIPILLRNGQYFPVDQLYNFTFPWLNQRIAFIVYNANEVNGPINYPKVHQYAEELRRSHINVAVIEAINFELYDVHIVAECIEKHRGQINPEQIAVLGGGTFDTIFQSQRTTFNTFFNIGKNELKQIRHAYVNSGNEKRVLAAEIDCSGGDFKSWSYPMNTVVNGFYEPDLIPDKNIFDTADGSRILFIITSAYNFQQIAAIQNVKLITSWFRDKIERAYPIPDWSVFLVGLRNFRERDCHLFAELVKMQTHDRRSLAEFVYVSSYGIEFTIYQYKDTAPFTHASKGKLRENFALIFGRSCNLSHLISIDN